MPEQRDPMTDSLLWPETGPSSPLAQKIAALQGMDRHGLRIAFRKVFRREAPEGVGRALLGRIIAYRMQALAHGDLEPWEEAVLAELLAAGRSRRARDLPSDPGNRGRTLVAGESPAEGQVGAGSRIGRKQTGSGHRNGPSAHRPRHHRPGTMLFREHAGEMHRVTIRHEGYEWRGERFTSLSEIARRITGTNWNGPRFFGLREKERQAQEKRP